MSASEILRLRQDLENPGPLIGEFRDLDDSPQAWAAWAVAHGYNVTTAETEDLEDLYSELDDDELDDAAGGWSAPGDPNGGG